MENFLYVSQGFGTLIIIFILALVGFGSLVLIPASFLAKGRPIIAMLVFLVFSYLYYESAKTAYELYQANAVDWEYYQMGLRAAGIPTMLVIIFGLFSWFMKPAKKN